VGRPTEFDVEEALASAMQKFRELGYEATSLSELTACTGVQKASLYATYGDKRTLFLSALQHYQELSYQTLEQRLKAAKSPRAALEAWFADAERNSAAKGKNSSCLCINTAIEFGDHDALVARALLGHAARIEQLIVDALTRAQKAREVSAELDLRAAARFLLTSLYGLQVAGKTGFDAKKLEQVVRLAFSVLAR
jgi:TetR/AcrR family transcriptional repressor of nem operon